MWVYTSDEFHGCYCVGKTWWYRNVYGQISISAIPLLNKGVLCNLTLLVHWHRDYLTNLTHLFMHASLAQQQSANGIIDAGANVKINE